jgi:hypothetical protein
MAITMTEEQTKTNLSNFLKKKIADDGHDLHEVANRTCFTAQVLVMYMQKTAFPNPEQLKVLAYYFNTTTNNILKGKF